MMTLMSHLSQAPETPRVSTSRPQTPTVAPEETKSIDSAAAVDNDEPGVKGKEKDSGLLVGADSSEVNLTSEVPAETPAKRPVIETFSTALEELPRNKELS